MPSIGHIAVGAAAGRIDCRNLPPEHLARAMVLLALFLFAFCPRGQK